MQDQFIFSIYLNILEAKQFQNEVQFTLFHSLVYILGQKMFYVLIQHHIA